METFQDHINEVSEAYEKCKEAFTDFVVDVQPSEYCRKPLAPRIENIYELISNLRNLAAKKPGEVI